jgi:hypothetical protein
MSTIFRFAIQTKERRYSEVWSFFANKKTECVYATRTSMREWLKISFHQSRACHIKSNKSLPWEKDFEWEHDELFEDKQVHAMRVVYEGKRQNSHFEVDNRIKTFFEEWDGLRSFYLDVFFTSDKSIVEAEEENGVVASHCINGRKWVYIKLGMSFTQIDLPESVSGMTLHSGKHEEDAQGGLLINSTVLFYSVPSKIGTLTVYEASLENVSINSLSL